MLDTPHPQVENHADEWSRIRDVMLGSDMVKSRGTEYLPKLDGASEEEYQGYLMRALFYNAAARTVSGLTGSIFRKDPRVEASDDVLALLGDITPTGAPFTILAKQVVEEVIAMGRVGLLVDLPSTGGDRPYVALYGAEDILSWRVEYINGEQVLQWVILHEVVEEETKPYTVVEVEQWRVLSIKNGVYTQEVYRKVEGGREDDFQLVEVVAPTRKGRGVDRIPFLVVGPSDIGMDVERSPMLDLVDVNLSHYRTSADLEHGAHFTALPTYWATAPQSREAGDYRVGSGVAWLIEAGGHAGILEYEGQGLQALEARIEAKQKLMAVLGARLLEDQKKAVETADAIRLRHTGENSVIAAISNTVSRGLTIVLTWIAEWAGAGTNVKVALNKDFIDVSMSGADLQALVAAWQSGAISRRTLFENLQRGEIIATERTFDEETGDIDADPPLGLLQAEADIEATKNPPVNSGPFG